MKKEIFETFNLNAEKKIDPSTGSIQKVAVLGKNSKNQRKYTEKALKSAEILINERPSYFNHDKKGNRDVRDLLGVFRNTIIEGEVVKADLFPLSKENWLFEVAEKMPNTIGFSISATGEISQQKDIGIDIVEDITEIISIDLVSSPATVKGLFEEKNKMDEKEILEEKIRLEQEKKKIEEEIKSLEADKIKVLEEKKKIEDEKKKIEEEKNKQEIEKTIAESLDKKFSSPEFLEICLKSSKEDLKKIIEDRKNLIRLAQDEVLRGFAPRKDNTFAGFTLIESDDEKIQEEIRKKIKRVE